MAGKPQGTPYSRMMDKVLLHPRGCWVLCMSGVAGYAGIWVNGRTVRAHRFSYEHHKGSIPDGMLVMHSCDNPRCVNPEHLRLGTAQENMDDMRGKGRANYTGRPPTLTQEFVDKVRAEYVRGYGAMQKLADKYGVNVKTLNSFLNGRAWK
jgi:hypothetical protein